MNKQKLANRIWAAANKMRSKIDVAEYKDYILGLLFYKYLSYRELDYLKEMGVENPEDIAEALSSEVVIEETKKNLGYFIPYRSLYSSWMERRNTLAITEVQDALNAFDKQVDANYNALFNGIFNDLSAGLNKLGENGRVQVKAVINLLELLQEVPVNNRNNDDILGFIYEYLLKQFAANAGKKAGEFYTPKEVSIVMSEIVAHHMHGCKSIKIYDPTSGSGSLLINIGKSATKSMEGENRIEYYAQELKENTYNLTKMNLIMRGILAANIHTRNADTLADDWPKEAGSENLPLRVDACVANPPYSQHWDNYNMHLDERFKRYGVAPSTKADYAFLLHCLYHINETGIVAIVLPHGVLFRGNEEQEIRKALVEANNIDAIIGLPPNIFYGAGIPTIVMILKKGRNREDILIVDASKGFEKESNQNVLRARDIRLIADVVNGRKERKGYSKKVTRDEVRANDYNLNIPRYVDSSEKEEDYDLFCAMFGGVPEAEISNLREYWEVFPTLKDKIFKNLENGSYEIETDAVEEVVKSDDSVKAFENKFKNALEPLPSYLTEQLVAQKETLHLVKGEENVAQEIFNRFSDLSPIDPYAAYQIFSQHWNVILPDLETIKEEKIEELKNKAEMDSIIPKDLLCENTESLKVLQDKIKDNETTIEGIRSQFTEALEELTEEEKDSCEAINESGTAFKTKEANAFLKQFQSDSAVTATPLYQAVRIFVEGQKKITQLKKENKNTEIELDNAILDTYANLSDEKINELLKKKWIDPLMAELSEMSDSVVRNLIEKIKQLDNKYQTTLPSLQNQIEEVSKELGEMLGEIEGSESDKAALKALAALLGEQDE